MWASQTSIPKKLGFTLRFYSRNSLKEGDFFQTFNHFAHEATCWGWGRGCLPDNITHTLPRPQSKPPISMNEGPREEDPKMVMSSNPTWACHLSQFICEHQIFRWHTISPPIETHPLQWYRVGKPPICLVGCIALVLAATWFDSRIVGQNSWHEDTPTCTVVVAMAVSQNLACKPFLLQFSLTLESCAANHVYSMQYPPRAPCLIDCGVV